MYSKKTLILYFSSTGNSLSVAKNISSINNNIEIKSIISALNSNIYSYSEYETIGFIFPLYFMGIPRIVHEYINKIELTNVKYTFSLVTRAYTKGKVLTDINNLLVTKGLKLNYGKYLTFPDNYIRWASAINKDKQSKLLAKTEPYIDSIYMDLKDRVNHVESENFILKYFYSVVNVIWKNTLKNKGKTFKVYNSCTSCKICEKNCPSKNIILIDSYPVWLDKCEDCMLCVQHCPKKAIYFNSKTIKKQRYLNPNISSTELLDLY